MDVDAPDTHLAVVYRFPTLLLGEKVRMSKVRGYLLLILILLLLVAGCRAGVATPSPTPVPTAIMTPKPTPLPTPTPTATPSPTPTVDVAAVMQEVRDFLAEAAALEADQEFEAAQEVAFQALGLYLSLPEVEGMSEEEIANELFSLGEEAGVGMWVTGVALLRMEPALYLVQFGSYPIALFWGEVGLPFDYYPVAEGDAILDGRLVGDEMGIIFAYIGASTVTPDFILLRHEEDGWRKVWPSDPEPWRDLWITADGRVSFAAQDLSFLKMEGSSWGVFLEEDPFFECHACAHRFFDVLWEREGDKYLPQVTLPLDAPYYDRLWEITQPSPYASLFEFLRRLRAGDELGALELVAETSLLDQAVALGLDDRAVIYMVEWGPESQATLPFSTEDLTREFVATFVQPGEGEHWLLTDIEAR